MFPSNYLRNFQQLSRFWLNINTNFLIYFANHLWAPFLFHLNKINIFLGVKFIFLIRLCSSVLGFFLIFVCFFKIVILIIPTVYSVSTPFPWICNSPMYKKYFNGNIHFIYILFVSVIFIFIWIIFHYVLFIYFRDFNFLTSGCLLRISGFGWLSLFISFFFIVIPWITSYKCGKVLHSLPPVCSVTRSLVLCICFVDRCLSFFSFFFWPLCCLFFFDLLILITHLKFSNSLFCVSLFFHWARTR